MKLLHSRALLSASRSASCRGTRCTAIWPVQSLPHSPPQQWHLYRTLTTSATPSPSTNTHQDDQTLSLSTQVRLLMRQVPYPVAIITSTDPAPSKTHHTETESNLTSQFRGMTVSSFNTVTLTPQPVISFNVRRPSETLHALLSSGRFLVHLLATNPHTAALARDFARGNQNLALGEGEFEFVGVKPSTSFPANVGDSQSVPSPPLPLLQRRPKKQNINPSAESASTPSCFPFIFECQILPQSVVNVYDHTIVVGAVVRAITSEGANELETSSQDLCLTYANTKFWEVGDEVV
ncbi:hypothetical protein ASPVEDRAFT_86978 [Aspergillus versicolor CBS 583.65]|uniref:Flavin reductase like domain-containing protein n=1 Tax=Aspergillus versicolor CBS 583.65 TaxID=1036611 RepID=A0A1L9PW38_ASPVE|nr:uncharacterized protein ASPVEDRAFT_86978 [Aspergillus versicolor CBS 583.65]OJJ05636.1 hypothetical protein ASPVEDRAFT_86978 [Aspergillus versicolor CBS 583.65]